MQDEIVNEEPEDEPEPQGQKITFKPPQLNEDEERNPFLPDYMKCDGCQAVATQWHRAFKREYDNRQKGYRMGEVAISDMLGELLIRQEVIKAHFPESSFIVQLMIV